MIGPELMHQPCYVCEVVLSIAAIDQYPVIFVMVVLLMFVCVKCGGRECVRMGNMYMPVCLVFARWS